MTILRGTTITFLGVLPCSHFCVSGICSTCRSRFLQDDGHRIDPFEMIRERPDPKLAEAVGRIAGSYRQRDAEALLDSIPEEHMGMPVLPAPARELYKRVLKERYERGLLPCGHVRQGAPGPDDGSGGSRGG